MLQLTKIAFPTLDNLPFLSDNCPTLDNLPFLSENCRGKDGPDSEAVISLEIDFEVFTFFYYCHDQ